MTRFSTLYNLSAHRRELVFATINSEESLTQQSDALDCDINLIMAKYAQTGQLPQVQMQALYGDFSDVGDFTDAQNRIIAANEAFAGIPAHIRAKFHNNAAEFIEFAQNPENHEEMVKMGLLDAPKEEIEPPPQKPPKGAEIKTEYSDDGETSFDARGREIDPTSGARERDGEGKGAVRQPQGVRSPQLGKPR